MISVNFIRLCLSFYRLSCLHHLIHHLAVSVILQTNEFRQSQDIDFVIANKVSNEEILEKQYRIVQENGK